MITGVNIRAVENGFFMTYWDDGVSKDRAFLTWESLCDWLKEQVAGLPEKKKK